MGTAGEELMVKSGKCQSLVLGVGSCEKQEPFCLVLASERKHSKGKESECASEKPWLAAGVERDASSSSLPVHTASSGLALLPTVFALSFPYLAKSLSVRNFLGGGCWALLIFINKCGFQLFSKIANVCVGNER